MKVLITWVQKSTTARERDGKIVRWKLLSDYIEIIYKINSMHALGIV